MEGLSRSQVLKALQAHKKYQHKTQKEISKKFQSIDDLRTELYRLENKKKSVNKNELIYLEGTGYTKEELIKMVNYYHQHVTIPSQIPELNNDMMKEIMLNASSNTIKNLCLTNKVTNQICNDKIFWHDKFEHDQLPHLVIIKKHQDAKGNSLQIPSNMKRLPTNVNKWLNAYDKMKRCNEMAIDFVDYILKNKKFTSFTAIVFIHFSLWLPKNMIDFIVNDSQHEINLYFEVKNNKFNMELIKQIEEDEIDEEYRVKMKLSQKEFIYYLTLLFYYEGDDEEFGIEEDEGDEIYYNFTDLKNKKYLNF